MSQSCVSRVLNNAPIRISETQRQKILNIAQRLNYSPNRVAQALKTGKRGIIGVLAYDITDAFAVECIFAMEKYLVHSPYRAMWISCAHADQDKIKPGLMLADIAHQVDGIIIISSNHFLKDADILNCWADTHIPMVSIIRTIPGDTISSVVIDDPLATTLLMEYLIELGHQRIAFCYSERKPPSAVARYHAYKELLSRYGYDLDKDLHIAVDGKASGGYLAGKKICQHKNRPTAVVGFNDLTAIGLLNACFEQGLKVGRDISVASFDNIRIAENTSPPLTTVGVRYDELARLAIDELDHLMDCRDTQAVVARHRTLTPELAIRKSTGSVKT